MSVKSGIQVSAALASRLEQMHSPDTNVMVLKVQVIDDVLQETASLSGSPTTDTKVIFPLAEETAAAYFLLKVAAGKWVLIQWVPNNIAKIKERMIYASTHAILKEAFGQEYITDVVNVTTKEELVEKKPSVREQVNVFSNSPASSPVQALPSRLQNENLLSSSEKSEREAIIAEAQARKELELDGKKGIGGYHPSTVSLSSDVMDALAKLRSGDVNFIEFSIGDDQKQLVCANKAGVWQNDIPKYVNAKEPRFYLYSYGNSASSAPKKNVFIYCCPEASITKSRMVYSTAKPSVIANLEAENIVLQRKLEITDLSEMTHQSIVAAAQDDGRSYGSSEKHVSTSVTAQPSAAPHPIFGYAGSDAKVVPNPGRSEFEASAISVGSGRKKIVLPPPVAYQ